MMFHLNQRVRAIGGRLDGMVGIVIQLRRVDRGAFVEMDLPLPKHTPKLFPNINFRDRWVILQPDQAEPEASKKK